MLYWRGDSYHEIYLEFIIKKISCQEFNSSLMHSSVFTKVIEIRWLAPMRIMLVCRSDFGFVLNKGCQSHFNAQTKHIFSTHDISIFWLTVLLKKHLVVTFRDFALIWLCFWILKYSKIVKFTKNLILMLKPNIF